MICRRRATKGNKDVPVMMCKVRWGVTRVCARTCHTGYLLWPRVMCRVAHGSGTGRQGPTRTRTHETRTRTGTGTNPHRLPAGFEQHCGYPQTCTVISLFSYFFIDLSCFLLFSFFFMGLHRLYLFYSMYYTICNYVI